MSKKITVKGQGKVNASPDLVVLSMVLESHDFTYEKAMDNAARDIETLNTSVKSAGFEKKALKTTSFNVRTDYEYKRNRHGDSERVFSGYVVNQDLKLEFDFDSKKLAETLSVVGSCPAHPKINIQFTVKDPTAIKEEMLRLAVENAKRKAEILCDAAGEQLGELLSIDYNWGELNIYSDTRYEMEESCLAAPMACGGVDMEPDDIKLSDTVTLVWEIK